MKMNEFKWKWMEMNGNEWKWMKMNENEWEWMQIVARSHFISHNSMS